MQPAAKLEKRREKWGKAPFTVMWKMPRICTAATRAAAAAAPAWSALMRKTARERQGEKQRQRRAKRERKGRKREGGVWRRRSSNICVQHAIQITFLSLANCGLHSLCIARKSMLRFVQKGVQAVREREKERQQQGLTGIGIQSDTHTVNNDTCHTLD